MKKTINILFLLLLTIILTSCFTTQYDVNKAKQDLGIIDLDSNNDSGGNNVKNKIENQIENITEEDVKEDFFKEEEKIEKKVEVQKIVIESLTDEQFLEFDDLSNENIFDGKIEITGKTLKKVDKIIVTFVNEGSDFPVDTYILKQFSSGDEKFLYRAFTKYETLDDGKNVYVFEAFSGDTSTKLQIIINVIEEEKEENIIDSRVEDIETQVYENIDFDSLPVKESFGTPVDLGNGKISYTDLKGLEIKVDVVSGLTCENITSVLADRINSWFFWNTCRPIDGEEGISFFVIRLDGDNYIYEKHYYLSYEGIYGIQELEMGTGIDSTNIGEKNSELKLKNDDFDILKISDDLFIEILK